MKHSDLKVGMKVKRVSDFSSGYYASTKGNVSTVEYIDNDDLTFSVEEEKQRWFEAKYFEPVIGEQVKEEVMQKIGMNKKYKTRCGYPVRILCVDRKDEEFPVVALIGDEDVVYAYRITGNYYADKTLHNMDLIEVSPWEDFKKDDKVMVSCDDNEDWYKRYFAYEKDDVAYCYADGCDSWSHTGDCVEWPYCRKPTQEELGE